MNCINTIGIIGAGASGLVAASVLIQNGFSVTVFEQSADIGGVWNYAPGVSAMYDSLRTNLPKEIMGFNQDNLIEGHESSFLTHHQIQSYLLSFTDKHQLRQMIKFNHKVLNVSKQTKQPAATCENSAKWVVEYEIVQQGEVQKNTAAHTRTSCVFDAILVCNGHFSVPYTPTVPTLSNFRGQSEHSNQYDTIKPTLLDKVVLIVGTMSSGTDVAKELLAIAVAVHVSDRNYADTDTYTHATLPANMQLHPAIREFAADGSVIFADGSMVGSVDVILWCTGYLYDYPFLSTQDKAPAPAPHITPPFPASLWSSVEPALSSVISDLHKTDSVSPQPVPVQVSPEQRVPVEVQAGKRVRPLYQQLFAIEDPSLVLLGLPFRVVPFPLFYLQAEYVAAVFTGRVHLPSVSDQYAWLQTFEEELAHNNLYAEKYHFLGGDPQWVYCRQLATASGLIRGQAVSKFPGTADPCDESTGDNSTSINQVPIIDNPVLESAGVSLRSNDSSSADAVGKDMARYLDVLEEIYNDNIEQRPRYPGDSDSYRNRKYRVNWTDYTWAVCGL